jgi:hypothetical protein
MLQLKKTNTFTIPVRFSMPGTAPGTWRQEEIQATFKAIPRDELEQLENADGDKILALLDKVVVDVKGVETDERKEDGTPYTPLEVAKLNSVVSLALASAFWDTVARDVEAKNSKRSRAR